MNAGCLGEFFAWLQFFDDLPLVTVLAAHATTEWPLSERDCAARTCLDRKTVRKKKKALIERGVLYRLCGQPTPGQSDPCAINWTRLRELAARVSR